MELAVLWKKQFINCPNEVVNMTHILVSHETRAVLVISITAIGLLGMDLHEYPSKLQPKTDPWGTPNSSDYFSPCVSFLNIFR